MKRGLKFCLFLLVLSLFLEIEIITAQSISLNETSANYTIENDYYRAVVSKTTCLVRALYVKNSSGNWSSSLVMENLFNYGLGFMEGAGNATGNDAIGLQENCSNIVVLENTSTRIKILGYTNNLLYNAIYRGTNFTEIWTFWANKPYFQSEASAIVVDNSTLSNQFQFAWMINQNLTNRTSYATDENGNITHSLKPSDNFQQVQSSNLSTYPWINYQFFNDSVSLGMIFTDISDPYGTIGETSIGFWEYQLDFELGTGVSANPVKKDFKRAVTTIYYTDNQTKNDDIANFSKNHYQNASVNILPNPVIQASAFINNPTSQNSGLGSALVNSPYFLVRQNLQKTATNPRNQSDTSIYAPLYREQDTAVYGDYPFADQLIYTLNYDNDTSILQYGNISQISANNSDYETSLQMNATSNDSKLFYSSTFKTWNDSDKLEILGSASNASSNTSVKEIYISLKMPLWGPNKYQAETVAPSSYVDSIPGDVTGSALTDNLYTDYNYAYDSGDTLIYRDSTENVPAIPIFLSNAQYFVTAYVQRNIAGNITYTYSTDNQTWNNFTVQNLTSTTVIPVNLGLVNVTNGVFYINDDDNATSGINQWAGWDMVTFTSVSDLGSNVYDFKMNDAIYGKLGIGIKLNFTASNISIINSSEIDIYLYQNSSAQNLTNFSYSFDVDIYPHKGWLNDSSQFTGLHSRDILNYSQHVFYVPEGIQRGRTNTIYPSGAVDYSSEPYDNSSKVNMTIIPSDGSLNITSIGFSADSKTWIETASNSTAVTNHTIGDLNPGTGYNVKIDGNLWNTYTSNSSGYINFVYNGGYSTKTFEIVKLSSPPALSGGGYPLFASNQAQLEKGYTKSLFKSWEIEFKFENVTHIIRLDDIINKTAIITMSSESQTFNLTAYETKKFDLNGDGFYDLQISAGSISDMKADLTVTSIHEKVSIGGTGEVIKDLLKGSELFWGIIISSIFVLALSLIFLGLRKKRGISTIQ